MAQQMTADMVKAVGAQGWAVKREIKATLVVSGRAEPVIVVDAWSEGALIARKTKDAQGEEITLLAHRPCNPSLLTISDEDAAHLRGVSQDKQALQTGQFFSGGRTYGNCTHNWR